MRAGGLDWLRRRFAWVNARSSAPHDLLWSKGIAAHCDVHGPPAYAHAHTEAGQGGAFFRAHYAAAGGVVWIRLGTRSRHGQPCDLDDFAAHALPAIRRPFALVTTDGDTAVPSELAPATVAALLDSPFLVGWRTQNHDGYRHPKLGPIPIGLDLHTPRPEGDADALAALLRRLRRRRVSLRGAPLRVFSDIGLNVNSGERRQALAQLDGCGHVDFLAARVSQEEVWRRYASYPFVLSAFGNGLDCHRTYEALYLGAIVIAKRSSLDPLYAGLPVALVDAWSEIRDAARLAAWRRQYGPLTRRRRVLARLHPETWLAPLRDAVAAAGPHFVVGTTESGAKV